MKIAVCISGVVRANNPLGSVERYNDILISKFPTADFYYGTWGSNRDAFSMHLPNTDCVFLEEPKMHYHPYYDIREEDYASQYFKETFDWVKTGGAQRREWTSHHTKQILIHAALVKQLPRQYDVIVRTRYDAYIHPTADFTQYVIDTHNSKRANGFAVTQKEKFLEMYQSNLESHPKMKYWMLDQLIIHPHDMINTSDIERLHTEKKLNPAEHGWYQVLSKPYGSNHINNHGWVNHDKNVMSKFF